MTDFSTPDWNEPLDIEFVIDTCPEEAMMRGMYTLPVCKLAGKMTGGQHFGRDRYIAFKFYPMREHIRVIHDCAAAAYPDLPIRLALRNLSSLAIPTLQKSLVGRTLLTLSGGTTQAALKILEKAFLQARNLGSVKMRDYEEGRAIFELRDVWDFPDSVQVGIFESAIKEAVGESRVLTRRHSISDVDVLLEWGDRL